MDKLDPRTELESKARVPVEVVAAFLSCHLADVRWIEPAGGPKPLGSSALAKNSVKFYCSTQILALREDEAFLERFTRLIARHHRAANEKQKTTKARAGLWQQVISPA